MPSFNSPLPEPLPKHDPSPRPEIHSNPYSDGSFVKNTLSDLVRGPKLPEKKTSVESEVKKEEKSDSKPGEFSILRRDLRDELKKAYDPYANLHQDERLEIEKEIVSKRQKTINEKEDIKKYFKHLGSESRHPSDKDWAGASKKLRFFDKFWKNLKNKQ